MLRELGGGLTQAVHERHPRDCLSGGGGGSVEMRDLLSGKVFCILT